METVEKNLCRGNKTFKKALPHRESIGLSKIPRNMYRGRKMQRM